MGIMKLFKIPSLFLLYLFIEGSSGYICLRGTNPVFSDCPSQDERGSIGDKVTLRCSTNKEFELCMWQSPKNKIIWPQQFDREFARVSPRNNKNCDMKFQHIKPEYNGTWTCLPWLPGDDIAAAVEGKFTLIPASKESDLERTFRKSTKKMDDILRLNVYEFERANETAIKFKIPPPLQDEDTEPPGKVFQDIVEFKNKEDRYYSEVLTKRCYVHSTFEALSNACTICTSGLGEKQQCMRQCFKSRKFNDCLQKSDQEHRSRGRELEMYELMAKSAKPDWTDPSINSKDHVISFYEQHCQFPYEDKVVQFLSELCHQCSREFWGLGKEMLMRCQSNCFNNLAFDFCAQRIGEGWFYERPYLTRPHKAPIYRDMVWDVCDERRREGEKWYKDVTCEL